MNHTKATTMVHPPPKRNITTHSNQAASLTNPRPDHYVLQAFASALSEVATLKTTLHTLRLDYLALELELRERMDEYVVVRDQAKNWEKRCVAAEKENVAELRNGLRKQNERLVRRPFWAEPEEGPPEGLIREPDYHCLRVEEEVGRWKRGVKRRWRKVKDRCMVATY